MQADWEAKTITVAPKAYTPTAYAIESDWSGASYWYSVAALAKDDTAEINLLGLKAKSLQGDSAIVGHHAGVWAWRVPLPIRAFA